MSISANYPSPVWVNGYACNNCAQVAEAKKGVDPANPQAGPYGIDANAPGAANGQSPTVTFGGVLAGLNGQGGAPASTAERTAPDGRLNISV